MFDEIEFSICAASSTRFIKHLNAQESPFILYFKMVDLVTLVVLNELMDSDDEKPQQGKTRNWIKRRHERDYFNNIIQELSFTSFKSLVPAAFSGCLSLL